VKGVMLLGALGAVTGCSGHTLKTTDPVAHPSQVVRYDDLNLGDSTDVRILHERVEAAATQVCGPVDAHDVAQLWVRPCIQRAVAKAMASVNVTASAAKQDQ
jgi:UrcA family protein